MLIQKFGLFQKRIFVTALLLLVFSGISAENLTITFLPKFGNFPLVLNSEKYVTDAGDTIRVTQLKLYISQIRLKYKDKPTYIERDSYHLLNVEKDSTLSIVLKDVPSGQLENVSFAIGVDSATSCSGAMGGDLDPINGMYWAWNSGYINAKMEGKSNSCTTQNRQFQFHIGGYNGPDKSIQYVTIAINPQLKIRKKVLFLDMDVNAWFKGVVLSKQHSILSPGSEAVQMAKNYKNMFSVSKL